MKIIYDYFPKPPVNTFTGNNVMKVGVCWGICQKQPTGSFLRCFKCCLEPILICVKKTLTGNDVMMVGVCGGICQKWVFLERFVKTNRMLARPSPHQLLHSTRWEILKCWIQHKASGIRMTDVLHMFVNFIFFQFHLLYLKWTRAGPLLRYNYANSRQHIRPWHCDIFFNLYVSTSQQQWLHQPVCPLQWSKSPDQLF